MRAAEALSTLSRIPACELVYVAAFITGLVMLAEQLHSIWKRLR